MLDNDKLTYSPSRRTGAPSAERQLLTPDRAQKLDLLIHLLTNLKQPLIVCGPEGIGKSTLLKTFEDSHKDIWPICRLQGSAALSFESIIAQLSQFLNLSSSSRHFDMTSLRSFCEKQRVVLMIDDAGELLPGLIGELADFAGSLFGLRLVFAMDHDQFQQKADSDTATADCHVIELPPLNQRQCLHYLQNLSAQPDAQLSYNAITDDLVEALYRQTQGIPGKLLAELPRLGQYQSWRNRKLALWLGIAAILAGTTYLARSILTVEDTAFDKPKEAAQASDANIAVAQEPAKPSPTTQSTVPEQIAGEAPKTTTLLAEPEQPKAMDATPEQPPGPDDESAGTLAPPPPIEAPAEVAASGDSRSGAAPAASVVAPAASEPVAARPAETVPAAPVKPAGGPDAKPKNEDNDLSWIMAQPADNYTVQLMVLSSKSSALRFIKQHPDYRDNLKYYTVNGNGQEKYVLIFGSFLSSADALKRKSTLPEEFSQGLIKRFKHIQKESRQK